MIVLLSALLLALSIALLALLDLGVVMNIPYYGQADSQKSGFCSQSLSYSPIAPPSLSYLVERRSDLQARKG